VAQEQLAIWNLDKVGAQLRKTLRASLSAVDGLTEASEKLHRIAVLPFRDLLNDPVGPPLVAEFPDYKSVLAAQEYLTAIGVHSAGEYLPIGRHSVLSVCRQSLSNSANIRGISKDKDHEFFLELFSSVYRNIFGRQHTLVHTLLHSAQTEGALIEIPLVPTGREVGRTAVKLPSGSTKLFRLQLDSVLPDLKDETLLGKFVKLLWNYTPAKSTGEPREPNPQLVHLYSGRIAELLRNEQDPKKFWYCFFHTFQRNTNRATERLGEGKEDAQRLLDAIFGVSSTADPNEHRFPSQLREAVLMLQLFFLYREICGKWFYVIIPKQQQDLHMCFAIGASRQLNSNELSSLESLASTVRTELQDFLVTVRATYLNPDTFRGQWESMNEIIGAETVKALSRKGVKKSNYEKTMGGGLPQYLKFCERVSELAIHEGKKLHFDVVVSGGMFASEMLTKASSLCSEGSPPWTVLLKNSENEERVNSRVISQLLGNYEFLQEQGVVLYGSRDGHLLYLAKMLNPEFNAEQFTKAKHCYLLRVRANGDIHLFFGGEIVLWRRAGQYIVPQAFGHEYRETLTAWFKKHFSSEHVNYDVLAETIWSLSYEGKGGGSFVLGRMHQGPFKLKDHTYALSEVFPYAEGLPLVDTGSNELLRRLAVQDGAVVIDTDTGGVFGRRQLLPNTAFNWHEYQKEWETKGGNGRNGTRCCVGEHVITQRWRSRLLRLANDAGRANALWLLRW
jgi:hypothetical protein